MAQEPSQIQEIDDSQADAQLLLNLSEMIKNTVKLIENTRKELSEQRGMLTDTFENNSIYKEQQEAVKATSKIRNATKAEILKRTDISQIAEKVKSLQSEIRENSAALSDYLREYQRVSGQNTLEGEDGEVLEIVYVAKLKRVGK